MQEAQRILRARSGGSTAAVELLRSLSWQQRQELQEQQQQQQQQQQMMVLQQALLKRQQQAVQLATAQAMLMQQQQQQQQQQQEQQQQQQQASRRRKVAQSKPSSRQHKEHGSCREEQLQGHKQPADQVLPVDAGARGLNCPVAACGRQRQQEKEPMAATEQATAGGVVNSEKMPDVRPTMASFTSALDKALSAASTMAAAGNGMAAAAALSDAAVLAKQCGIESAVAAVEGLASSLQQKLKQSSALDDLIKQFEHPSSSSSSGSPVQEPPAAQQGCLSRQQQDQGRALLQQFQLPSAKTQSRVAQLLVFAQVDEPSAQDVAIAAAARGPEQHGLVQIPSGLTQQHVSLTTPGGPEAASMGRSSLSKVELGPAAAASPRDAPEGLVWRRDRQKALEQLLARKNAQLAGRSADTAAGKRPAASLDSSDQAQQQQMARSADALAEPQETDPAAEHCQAAVLPQAAVAVEALTTVTRCHQQQGQEMDSELVQEDRQQQQQGVEVIQEEQEDRQQQQQGVEVIQEEQEDRQQQQQGVEVIQEEQQQQQQQEEEVSPQIDVTTGEEQAASGAALPMSATQPAAEELPVTADDATAAECLVHQKVAADAPSTLDVPAALAAQGAVVPAQLDLAALSATSAGQQLLQSLKALDLLPDCLQLSEAGVQLKLQLKLVPAAAAGGVAAGAEQQSHPKDAPQAAANSASAAAAAASAACHTGDAPGPAADTADAAAGDQGGGAAAANGFPRRQFAARVSRAQMNLPLDEVMACPYEAGPVSEAGQEAALLNCKPSSSLIKVETIIDGRDDPASEVPSSMVIDGKGVVKKEPGSVDSAFASDNGRCGTLPRTSGTVVGASDRIAGSKRPVTGLLVEGASDAVVSTPKRALVNHPAWHSNLLCSERR
jgi:hypothetical protein